MTTIQLQKKKKNFLCASRDSDRSGSVLGFKSTPAAKQRICSKALSLAFFRH
jgi:hypothetical protein